STRSDLWGDVTLYHNGIKMDSLYLFTIRLKNISNFDAESIPVNTYCDIQSQILSYSSFHEELMTGVLLDQAFYDGRTSHIAEVESLVTSKHEDSSLELTDEQRLRDNYYARNLNYTIAVLNRKSSCEFSILVGSTISNTKSELFFNIPKKGVSLTQVK